MTCANPGQLRGRGLNFLKFYVRGLAEQTPAGSRAHPIERAMSPIPESPGRQLSADIGDIGRYPRRHGAHLVYRDEGAPISGLLDREGTAAMVSRRPHSQRDRTGRHIGRIRPTRLAGAFCVLAKSGAEINQNLWTALRESTAV